MSKKKKKVKPMFCAVCLHNPPMGKCLICGYTKATDEIDPHWKLRHDWLKTLHTKMRQTVANSTGYYDLDLEIVQKFGPWRSDIKVIRDELSYKITKIEVPISASELARMKERSSGDKDILELLRRYGAA